VNVTLINILKLLVYYYKFLMTWYCICNW